MLVAIVSSSVSASADIKKTTRGMRPRMAFVGLNAAIGSYPTTTPDDVTLPTVTRYSIPDFGSLRHFVNRVPLIALAYFSNVVLTYPQ